MAQVGVRSTTSSSITLYIHSLDTSWSKGERTVYWYLGSANGGIPTESAFSYQATRTLKNGVSNGADVTFSGLQANSTYCFYCKVVWESTMLFETDGSARTDTGETTQSWSKSSTSLGTIEDPTTVSFTMKEYNLKCYSFTFSKSGNATFYTTGKTVDTYGFLTDSTQTYDSATGIPNGILDESDIYRDDVNDGMDDGLNFSITYPIEANTLYRIWIRGYYGDETGNVDLCIIPPESTGISITRWDWFSVNDTADSAGGTASAEQTEDSYNAITGVGAGRNTLNFSRKVWNDMVAKVNEIVKASYGAWDDSYASYSATRFTFGPYELTAVKFNSLRNNLELAGTNSKIGLNKIPDYLIPHPVEAEDFVYGGYFITLTDYMNECIDKLSGL